jgi:hypothetical protein
MQNFMRSRGPTVQSTNHSPTLLIVWSRQTGVDFATVCLSVCPWRSIRSCWVVGLSRNSALQFCASPSVGLVSSGAAAVAAVDIQQHTVLPLLYTVWSDLEGKIVWCKGCLCLKFIPCRSDVLEEKTNNMHWLYLLYLFLRVGFYMFRQ